MVARSPFSVDTEIPEMTCGPHHEKEALPTVTVDAPGNALRTALATSDEPATMPMIDGASAAATTIEMGTPIVY